MMRVEWVDGTVTEYPGCERIDSDGIMGKIVKFVDGVDEIVAEFPMAEIHQAVRVEPEPEEAPCVEK